MHLKTNSTCKPQLDQLQVISFARITALLYTECTVDAVESLLFIMLTAFSRRAYPERLIEELLSLYQKHILRLVHQVRDEEYHRERFCETRSFQICDVLATDA